MLVLNLYWCNAALIGALVCAEIADAVRVSTIYVHPPPKKPMNWQLLYTSLTELEGDR